MEYYALEIDGRTSELYMNREEAARAASMAVEEGEADIRIRKLKNLRAFVEEYADFEDPDNDEWMENVIESTMNMIQNEKRSRAKGIDKQDAEKRSKDLLERAAEGTSGMTLDEIAAEHAEEPEDEQ